MNATRTIVGRPVRSATEVADAIVELVASTLDVSPHIAGDDVRAELAPAVPTFALLAAGGHLADAQLLLMAADLRLSVVVPVGEAALAATENSAPPRGAATATTWMLYLPDTEGMAALTASTAAACPHVSTEAPPSGIQPASAGSAAGIDLSRLLDRGNR